MTEAVAEATDRLVKRVHGELSEKIRTNEQIKLANALNEVVTDQKAYNLPDDWISAEFQEILAVGSAHKCQSNDADEYLGNFELVEIELNFSAGFIINFIIQIF